MGGDSLDDDVATLAADQAAPKQIGGVGGEHADWRGQREDIARVIDGITGSNPQERARMRRNLIDTSNRWMESDDHRVVRRGQDVGFKLERLALRAVDSYTKWLTAKAKLTAELNTARALLTPQSTVSTVDDVITRHNVPTRAQNDDSNAT